ncbi:MAG: leucine-rich repeat domain-containing protein [Bacteroidales bacterium]|nr:leucine-rich repeat domain-containing protein [Bacteroidales bacterium]
MKRIAYFAVLMLLSGFASLLQAQVFSDIAPSGQTLYYKITDKTKQQVALTFPGHYGLYRDYWDGYTKPAGRVVVPSTVTHDGVTYTVVSFREAFHGCDGLTSLFVPKTVTDISVTSFEYCRNLAEISVHPDNPVFDSRGNCNAIINTKENELVYGCKNATIPNSVTSIAWYAFRGSGLTSITIPSSVKYISGQAFYGCPLTELFIPATVEDMGADAFMDDHVTATLANCPLKLEVNKYHFDYEYDEDGYDYGVCVVPCGWKKTYENSGWGKFFLFRENCELHDINIEDEANCGLKTSLKKAKFGDMVQLTCTPGDYDIFILWGDSKTTIKVENNSFMMPYHEVTVKSVRKSNAE